VLNPGLHAQIPPPSQYLLLLPPAHATPHIPQFCGSLWRSEQAFPQVVPAQLHAPFTQVSPSGHCVAQLPQNSGSLAVFVQTPPHCCMPAGHTHWPFMHDSPGLQVLPHWPQLSALEVRSTQPVKPPQLVCPATAHAH
jgi:hypothetical protein